MAAEHRYTSSLFIQKGALAQFQSGISASNLNVNGNVFASAYFKLDGTEVTGGGGLSAAKFFAGKPNGISQSGNPFSEDNFFSVNSTNKETVDIGGVDVDIIQEGFVKIETTGSVNFKPNFFNFLKVGNNNEDLITVQQGGLNQRTYIPSTIDERKPGVHRYIIYAAETGSTGETHQVFHTVTLDAFVNIAPVLVKSPSSPVISIGHDASSGSIVFDFSDSNDPNQTTGQADFLTFFEIDRTTSDPSLANSTSTTPEYNLLLSSGSVSDSDQITLTSNTSPGLSPLPVGSTNILTITASISSFNNLNSEGNDEFKFNTIEFNQPQTENFNLTLKDDNEFNDTEGVVNDTLSLIVNPPPTSSITNIRIRFEGSDNKGGLLSDRPTFQSTELPPDSQTHTHTMLYDTTTTFSSHSINSFHDRYTSSIVRLRALADISEPDGFIPAHKHHTFVMIQKGPNDGNNKILGINDHPIFNFFRFNGGESVASAINTNDIIYGDYTTVTGSNGYKDFEFTPDFSNSNSDSVYIGTHNNTKTHLNKIGRIQHGDSETGTAQQFGGNDHYVAEVTSNPAILTINKCPNILIDNIVVEVESGSFNTNVGHPNLTSSLLYGFTSSILNSDIGTILPSDSSYVNQSIVRFRLKAKITEPFGPGHNIINAFISTQSVDGGDNFSTDPIFLTKDVSNQGSTISNFSSGYTTNHNHSGTNQSGKELLVSHYTSSFIPIRVLEGANQEFFATFTDSSNAGSTINTTTSQSAIVSMSAPEPTTLELLQYEVETEGYSGEPDLSTTRTVLYGDARVTNDGTGSGESGFNWGRLASNNISNVLSDLYAETSVTRFRVQGLITEPVGPATSLITTQIQENGNNIGSPIEITPNLTPINNVGLISSSVSNYNNNNQLVTRFTSSWIGAQITTNAGSTSTHTISGVTTYTFDDNQFSNIDNTLTSFTPTTATLTINDTPATVITTEIKTETFGYSGEEINNTVRRVLYGDNRVTNDGTGSTETGFSWGRLGSNTFSNNISDAYASQSVSRTKIKAVVTEPLGHLHFGATKIINNFNSDTGNSISYNITNVNTSSAFFIDSTQDSTTNYKLVSTYSSSFIGTVLSSGTDSDKIWTLTPTVNHSPSSENGNTNTPTTSQITIKDTLPTEITEIEFITETSGYSGEETDNTTRTVLYGDARVTNNGTGSGESGFNWGRLASNNISDNLSDLYANNSVSRFKTKLRVTEPIGHAHHNTTINKDFNATSKSPINETITIDKDNSRVTDEDYNANNQLTYTFDSDFIGTILSSNNNASAQWTYNGSVTHNSPGTENGFNTTNGITNQSIITVNDTAPTQIKNVVTKTETFGYSGIETNSTIRNILYGDVNVTNDGTGSGETGAQWATYPHLSSSFASHSIARARTTLQIIEPIGHLHSNTSISTTLSSNADDVTKTINFNTSSEGAGTPTYVSNRLTYTFTQPFEGYILTSTNRTSGETYTTTPTITHNPSNENSFTLIGGTTTAEIIVKDTGQVLVTVGTPEIETFGDSNVGVQNREEGPDDNFLTLDSDFSLQSRTIASGDTTTRENSDGLSSGVIASSVLRVRQLLKIQEPLGFIHQNVSQNALNFLNRFDASGDESAVSFNLAKTLDYNTQSANFDNSNPNNSPSLFNKDEIYLHTSLPMGLISHYTTSFNSGGLALSAGNYDINADITSYNLDTSGNASGESSLTISGDSNNNTSNTLMFKVNGTTTTEFTNLQIQIEETSGSGYAGVGVITDRTTNILHGKDKSETNHTTNLTYPDSNDRAQLVSARVLATIIEPPGVTHFTPNITIGGASVDKTFTLSTASADEPAGANTDVSESIITIDSNGTTIEYTSVFFPLQFNANPGQTNTYTITPTINSIDNAGTSFTPFSPNSITITAIGAAASTVTTNIRTGSQFEGSFFKSSDTEESVYYDYPEGSHNGYVANTRTVNLFASTNVNEPTFSTTNNISFANNNLSLAFSENQTDFFISDSNNDGTASLVINDPHGFGNVVKRAVVTLTATDTLAGNGTDTVTKEVYVIPAKPATMTGNFGSKIFSAHSASGYIGTSNLYKGTLPSNIGTFDSGDAGGSVKNNIYITKAPGGGNNYNIRFNSHNSAVYSGNYDTLNRAFSHADEGHLQVLINGTKAFSGNGIDLAGTFDSGKKNVDQIGHSDHSDAFYNSGQNNGKKEFDNGSHPDFDEFDANEYGSLRINSVKPFNNVSQSISSSGEAYPNGYQSFDFSITLEKKIQEGYNNLQVKHTYTKDINDTETTVERTLNTVEWYYDDGTNLPTVSSTANITYEYDQSVNGGDNISIISASGIQYFNKNQEFLINFNNAISNIAHKTYRDKTDEVATTTHPIVNVLLINTGSSSPTNSSLSHKLNSVSNKKGLKFDGLSYSNLVPSTTSVASIVKLRVKGGSSVSPSSTIGELTFNALHRDLSFTDNFSDPASSQTVTVGRFIDPSDINNNPSTRKVEHFYQENKRLKQSVISSDVHTAGIEPSRILDEDDAGFHSSFKYNSNIALNFVGSNFISTDLQQDITQGHLVYPTQNYPTNPNSVNYTSADNQGDRKYYRAFQLTADDFGTFDLSNEQSFFISIFTDSGTSVNDIFANPATSFSSLPIQIRVKFPGPIGSSPSSNSPGSQFGMVNKGGGGDFQTVDWGAFSGLNTSVSNRYKFEISTLQSNLENSNGVFIIEVKYKSSYTGNINRIEVSAS